MIGWIAADQFVHGLKLAGPEFTQQKVIDALNTLTDVTVNGLIPPIDWTKQHIDPIEASRGPRHDVSASTSSKIKNGKFVPAFAEPRQAVGLLRQSQAERADDPPTPELRHG